MSSGKNWSPWIETLIQGYQEPKPVKKDLIKVSRSFSGLALAYEKVRNAVDFRGEHLFRRAAIERILRRLWALRLTPRETAIRLIRELTWSRYLKNRSVPKTTLDQLENLLAAYKQLKKSQPQMQEWLLLIASSQIDQTIIPQPQNEAWIKSVSHWFFTHYQWQEAKDKEARSLLVYIALHRAILNSDEAIVSYHLAKMFFPHWPHLKEKEEKLIPQLRKEIRSLIDHPLSRPLFRRIKKIIPPFLILKNILDRAGKKKIASLLEDGRALAEKVRAECSQQYQQTSTKIRRGIVRSVVYILATKMVFAFILEFPVEALVHRLNHPQEPYSMNYFPFLVNLIFPPLLILLVGSLSRPPGENNTRLIVKRIKEFVFSPPKTSVPLVVGKRKTSSLGGRIFRLLYSLLFVTTFSLITYFLLKIGFTVISLTVFFLFVCLVLLFGLRVRWAAQEWQIVDRKETFLETIINIITLPFLDVGYRLSSGLAKLSVLNIILDFLIEAPLKTVINIANSWLRFLYKKQEEVIEQPY